MLKSAFALTSRKELADIINFIFSRIHFSRILSGFYKRVVVFLHFPLSNMFALTLFFASLFG